jgi:hypothetical protein
MMTFDDQRIEIDTAFGPLQVTVTGEALHTLWGEGVGPQDAAGLVAANMALLRHVATIKFEADEGEGDYAVRITGADLEA